MNNNFTPYQNDILAQPQSLRDTIEYLENLQCPVEISDALLNEKWPRIILTGMGSSYFVLYPLYLRLVGAGKQVWLIETSELIHHQQAFLRKDTLIIIASQSGESAEIVRLLQLCAKEQTIIGITNNEQSPLAAQSSFHILTRAGDESAVSCKTYLTALVAQYWLGDQLLGGEHQFPQLENTPRLVEDYLSLWPAAIDELKQKLQGVRQVYLTGRGVSLTSVGTGGLILKESTHIASEGMSSAAFRHGPFEMISPETYLLVFEGLEPTRTLNIKLFTDFIDAGGRADHVRQGFEPTVFTLPECSDPVLPILEILPVQMITLALADLHGIQAGKFRFGNKITTDE
jgi:glutamine---fructose-6-phosphate transaminase (isomerizing)